MKEEKQKAGRERQKRWRERRKAEGKKVLTISISKEAKEILEKENEQAGESLSAIIDRALINRKHKKANEYFSRNMVMPLEIQTEGRTHGPRRGGKESQGENGMDIKITHPAEMFHAFVETASDFMSIVDKDFRFTYVNESMVRGLGYSKEEIIGMHVTEILSKERLGEFFKKNVSKIYLNGKLDLESFYVTKNGRKIYGEQKIVAVYDANGNFAGTQTVLRDITQRKLIEMELQKNKSELQAKTHDLQELNAALKVLLKHREEDKSELEEKVLSNVKQLLEPYLERLKKSRLDSSQQNYLDILESNLKEIIAPFTRSLSSKYMSLTPAEIKIANLVKLGRTSKEIAELLIVSEKTVAVHRENIRGKLGIKKKNLNLRSHLLSFQ